jgi:hypothetical protein
MSSMEKDFMDLDDRIESSGCATAYRLLDSCMVEHNRDWRKCQNEVLELRKCMAERTKIISPPLGPEQASNRR